MFDDGPIESVEASYPLQVWRDGSHVAFNMADIFPFPAKITAVRQNFQDGAGQYRTAYSWRKQEFTYGGTLTDSADGMKGLENLTDKRHNPAFAPPDINYVVGTYVWLVPTLVDKIHPDATNHRLEWLAIPLNMQLTDFQVTGIISGFNDQYIGGGWLGGGGPTVKQLHIISLSGIYGPQPFNNSDVLLMGWEMFRSPPQGSKIAKDRIGLCVRSGDRTVGPYQNVICGALEIKARNVAPDTNAPPLGPEYAHIEYRSLGTLGRALIFRGGGEASQNVGMALTDGNLVYGLQTVPSPGGGIFGDPYGSQLWVYGGVHANTGYSTIDVLSQPPGQIASGMSINFNGMRFRGGLFVGGSGGLGGGSINGGEF